MKRDIPKTRPLNRSFNGPHRRAPYPSCRALIPSPYLSWVEPAITQVFRTTASSKVTPNTCTFSRHEFHQDASIPCRVISAYGIDTRRHGQITQFVNPWFGMHVNREVPFVPWTCALEMDDRDKIQPLKLFWPGHKLLRVVLETSWLERLTHPRRTEPRGWIELASLLSDWRFQYCWLSSCLRWMVPHLVSVWCPRIIWGGLLK